ncbi:MAG: hypothetical protein LW832_02255 [Parachlamydia sp.]|jgi:hypothetical protein|nr:hypothetical protein [Parachlamydia sp.]
MQSVTFNQLPSDVLNEILTKSCTDPVFNFVCKDWLAFGTNPELLNKELGRDNLDGKKKLIARVSHFLPNKERFEKAPPSASLIYCIQQVEKDWNLITAFKQLKLKKIEEFFIQHFDSLNKQATALRTCLPDWKSELEKCKVIEIKSVKLTLIPEELFLFTEVEKVNLLNNKINTLTQKLNWPKLKHLNLQSNQIESIPENWDENTKYLNVINLCFNNIQSISSSFFEHVPLQHLIINNNELKELPASLGKEWHLMSIRLEHNQIKELPATFGENWKNSLREIKLYENPMQEPTNLKERWPKLLS